MSVGPLAAEIVLTFCLAAGLLYQYGNWYRHHVIVTIAVLIAWYFSFIIIFVLPLDISSTVYRQCSNEHIPTVAPTQLHNITELDNITSINATQFTPFVDTGCVEPWSYVRGNVLCVLWRVVYWTSQCLTWLILPMMQSYTRAGDFSVGGKLRSAIVDNAIYYSSYLFICTILLIYIAIKPELDLDWSKLKAIAASASNTWGLFLLVMLLGYGLVEVPRTLWNASKRGYMLHYVYFKTAKLSMEKSEAEETLDDVLESLKYVSENTRANNPLRQHVDTILQKIPVELQDRMNRRARGDDSHMDMPTEKQLIRLHKQVIKAIQMQRRTENQWNLMMERVIQLEDINRNEGSNDRRFKATFPVQRKPKWLWFWYTPVLEWYWKCILRGYLFRVLSIVCAVMSVMVVWSEVTFFNREPVLSLLAIFVNIAKDSYNYISIEMISSLTIAYLCVCAYYTIFRIRVLNYYCLVPHHQTDEYSLIFSGMLLCRLTPPMCLNVLGLVHMDSHIIQSHTMETCYTKIMGHMDVISIISDGFNIYFPMGILALCLATYFNVGSRLLTLLSFQQFVGDDDITANLVDDGRELVKREKRRRQRMEDTMQRQRDRHDKFGTTRSSTRHQVDQNAWQMQRRDSTESARAELLRDAESLDYMGTMQSDSHSRDAADDYFGEMDSLENTQRHSRLTGPPPRGIFDDV